jgi:hypothetical protein
LRIELLESFEKIAGGNDGLGDDQGYAWYADIQRNTTRLLSFVSIKILR